MQQQLPTQWLETLGPNPNRSADHPNHSDTARWRINVLEKYAANLVLALQCTGAVLPSFPRVALPSYEDASWPVADLLGSPVPSACPSRQVNCHCQDWNCSIARTDLVTEIVLWSMSFFFNYGRSQMHISSAWELKSQNRNCNCELWTVTKLQILISSAWKLENTS